MDGSSGTENIHRATPSPAEHGVPEILQMRWRDNPRQVPPPTRPWRPPVEKTVNVLATSGPKVLSEAFFDVPPGCRSIPIEGPMRLEQDDAGRWCPRNPVRRTRRIVE